MKEMVLGEEEGYGACHLLSATASKGTERFAGVEVVGVGLVDGLLWSSAKDGNNDSHVALRRTKSGIVRLKGNDAQSLH